MALALSCRASLSPLRLCRLPRQPAVCRTSGPARSVPESESCECLRQIPFLGWGYIEVILFGSAGVVRDGMEQ